MRPEDDRKSKSQRKREMLALQELGEKLVELSPDQIERIEMSEDLREAVLFAKTLTKHEARRRQLQYIGSLMRDADCEPIERALDNITQSRNLDVHLFQQVEKWRDALVAGDNALMDEILKRFPDADRTKLRQLVMNARKERSLGKPPKAYRSLFRLLMELARA